MAIFSGPEIIENGLVLGLDAANPRSYAGTGTNWTNLILDANIGSLINGPTYSSNNKGYFNLDGIDDVIDTNYTMPVSNFTVSCYYKKTGANYWATLWASEVWNNNTGYLSFLTGPNSIQFSRGGGSSPLVTDPSIYGSITNFNLYTFTCDSLGNAQIFINGSLASSGMIALASSVSKTIKLGARHTNDGTNFTDRGGGSQISQLAVYNKVLTSNEIRQNYNATRSRFGL